MKAKNNPCLRHGLKVSLVERRRKIMQERSWTYLDRSRWAQGEWDSEPDKIQFQDVATGLPCLVVRNQGGALCGYVGVIEGHPFFAVPYSTCPQGCDSYCDHSPEALLDVHGGITFADFCSPYGPEGERGICHVPEAGEPDRVYWFGFDCAHCDDVSPAYDFSHVGHYKSVTYVQAECRRLAAQLIAQADKTA